MGGILLHHDGQYEYPYLGIDAHHSSPGLYPPGGDWMDPSVVTQAQMRRAGYDKLRTLHSFVTKQEIQDRSKSDGLAKLVVLVQTAWFTGQCLARVVQKLAITELEIVTLAYTALNGVIYFFWWNKPLDVRFPLVIEVNLSEHEDIFFMGPITFRTPSPPLPHEILGDNETQLVAETHCSSPDPGEHSQFTQQVLPSPPLPHEISGDNETQLGAETHYRSPDPGERSQFTQQVLAVRPTPGRFPTVEKAWGRFLSLWPGRHAGMSYSQHLLF
jgi:hypothetical protein